MFKRLKKKGLTAVYFCALAMAIWVGNVAGWTPPSNPPYTEPVTPSYDDGEVETGCDCKEATLYVPAIVAVDWPQDGSSQATLWAWWSQGTSGWVKYGNATHLYNCHSYVFNGSDRWLDGSGRSAFIGSTSGCWVFDASGSIRSSSWHSCTSSYVGKVGKMFLQNKNDVIYGLISARYKKL